MEGGNHMHYSVSTTDRREGRAVLSLRNSLSGDQSTTKEIKMIFFKILLPLVS